MPSPSSKPYKPNRMLTVVGKMRMPITRTSSNSNSPLNSKTAGIAGPRPVRIVGTNKFTRGRIRNKKNSRGKRRKSEKKTKRKKRSN